MKPCFSCIQKATGGLVLAESEKETNEVERTTAPGMKYTAKSALDMISKKLVPSPTASKNSLNNFAFVYFQDNDLFRL